MKILKFVDSFLNFIVFSFFTLSLLFAFYALYDVHVVYDDTELSGEVLKYKPSTDSDGILENEFSLEDLKKINKDIVGWVKIDNTNIDYPILAGMDNTDYLKRNYKGEYSPSGSIFLDYRNNRKFTDDFSIIYGHNMAKGLMFSDIKKFSNSDFFETHTKGKLYTEDEIYDLEIYSYNILESNKDISYKLQKYNNGYNEEVVTNLLDSAINKRNLVVSDNDQYLLLSTCYGLNTYDRSVLLTKMVKSNSTNIIGSYIDNNKARLLPEDNKILIKNQRTNLVNKIIILLIYIIIGIMIYIHILVGHILKKKRIIGWK